MNPEHRPAGLDQRPEQLGHRTSDLEQRTTGLEQRLNCMKRDVRLYRAGLGVVLLVAIAVIVWGHAQPLPDVIQARNFEVVDQQGNAVVRLGSSLSSSGYVAIYNTTGKNLVKMTSTGDGGTVFLSNSMGEVTVFLGSDKDGGNLSISNHTGRTVAGLINFSSFGGGLSVCNSEGDNCRLFTPTSGLASRSVGTDFTRAQWQAIP